MRVNLKHRNRGATVTSIRAIVPAAAATQHGDWIDFLTQNDGAVPEVNEFDVGPQNGSGIQRFYSIAEVAAARRQLADRMSEAFLPIADVEGGNYVCLGLSPRSSGVLFWDHETEEATHISSSFSKFIDDLRPFDPGSVVLKPGQVVSAWIDPSLLEAETGKKK
jgi:hypothetical protein